jgi:hypothetical protein
MRRSPFRRPLRYLTHHQRHDRQNSGKKRYETTVILTDHRAAVPARTKKLKKWTDDFTDARNWLIRQLGAFRGDQYFAAIFDHMEKRSVFKEKGR